MNIDCDKSTWFKIQPMKLQCSYSPQGRPVSWYEISLNNWSEICKLGFKVVDLEAYNSCKNTKYHDNEPTKMKKFI